MKEIEDDINRQGDIYFMFLDRKNQYCENDYNTKCNHRFNEIPIKLPMAFFIGQEQKISQFI